MCWEKHRVWTYLGLEGRVCRQCYLHSRDVARSTDAMEERCRGILVGLAVLIV
jgi:hypothetical protein